MPRWWSPEWTSIPEVAHWPGVPPMFSFRDPDGNQLYLVQRE